MTKAVGQFSTWRERALRAVQEIQLPFTVEFVSGREQELVACLGPEGAEKIVNALAGVENPIKEDLMGTSDTRRIDSDIATGVRKIFDATDFLRRIAVDREARFECAREAGANLAGEVYRFTEDPEGVGTDALREAYSTFMGLDSGNFYVAGGRVVTGGVELIAAERERQEAQEGWTAEHDDVHDRGELLQAALCYASAARPDAVPGRPPHGWPWEASAWKAESNDPIHSLVKAGALIAAEIDRLKRAGV